MTRTYSTEQQAYLNAKAGYETMERHINRTLEARMSYAGLDLDNPDDLEKIAEIDVQLRIQFKAMEIEQALYDAEDALIAWGHKMAKTVKEYKIYRPLLEDMFSKINRFPVYRQKLIMLIMKLQVKQGKAA